MKKHANSGSKPPSHSISKAKKKCNKAECSKNKNNLSLDEAKRPSLLDILKNNEDCNCEIVARAVTSNVHMNLGLSNSRKHSRDLDLKVLKKTNIALETLIKQWKIFFSLQYSD